LPFNVPIAMPLYYKWLLPRRPAGFLF
jgi:hypothetical protein